MSLKYFAVNHIIYLICFPNYHFISLKAINEMLSFQDNNQKSNYCLLKIAKFNEFIEDFIFIKIYRNTE
jgi:hypothetical protein